MVNYRLAFIENWETTYIGPKLARPIRQMDHIGFRPLDDLEPQHLHNFGANEVVGAPRVQ